MPETQRQKFARRLSQMDETRRLHNDDEDRAEKMLGAAPLEGTPDIEAFTYGGMTSRQWGYKIRHFGGQNFGALLRNFALAYAAAVSKNSRAELGRVRKLFHNLTPGGSEFVNDPDYCAEYLREHLNIQHELVINSIKRAKAAEARISELEARLAVKITTGTESHWRGRDEIRSKP